MARQEIVEEKEIFNGQATWQLITDGTSKIVWAEGSSQPQMIPNKKV